MLLSYNPDIVNMLNILSKTIPKKYSTQFYKNNQVIFLLINLLLFYAFYAKLFIYEARIAQLVEQWIEDPRVTSSNLVLGIYLFKNFVRFASNASITVPIGPFRCFAIINSTRFI